MALLAKVGSIEAPIATGNFAITGVGFQGKIVMFWMTRVANGGFSSENRIAFGAAKSATERYCIECATADAVDGTGQISSRRMTQTAVSLYTAGGSAIFEADFVSWDSDGFTLNCTTVAQASGWQIHYMVLGGGDLTDVALQVQSFPTVTGNRSHTGIGFKPDCLIFATRNSTGIAGTTAFNLTIGAMCADGSQGTAGFRDQQIVPSDVATYQRSDKAFGVQNTGTAGVFSFEANFVSMDADGWTWNCTSVPTGNDFIVIALKGGSYTVKADTQKTSTGTKVTSIGFQAESILFLSTNRTSTTAQDTTIGKLSIGGTDGTGQAAIWVSDTDAANPTDANSYDSSSKVIAFATNPSTLDAEAGISAIGVKDYTLDWTTADAVAREFISIAFGSNTDYPRTSLLDNYNRAVAADLGPNYGVITTGMQIISGGFADAPTAGGKAGVYWLGFTAIDMEVFFQAKEIASYWIEWRMKNAARTGDPGTGSDWSGYQAFIDSGGPSIEIRRWNGSSLTTIGTSFSIPFALDNYYGFRHIGTTIETWMNSGGGWRLLDSRTDSANYTDGGRIGFETTGLLDNFGGGQLDSVKQTGYYHRMVSRR